MPVLSATKWSLTRHGRRQASVAVPPRVLVAGGKRWQQAVEAVSDQGSAEIAQVLLMLRAMPQQACSSLVMDSLSAAGGDFQWGVFASAEEKA